MAGKSANVNSIEAIRSFRAAVAEFEDDAAEALAAIRQQVLRSIEWVEHDRPQFWKQQVRRSFDAISEARSALAACEMKRVAGHRPSCIEEKKALEAAQRRLRISEEKVEVVRRCSAQLRHETDELRGRIGPLEAFLSGVTPKMLAVLERTLTILEDYAEIKRVPEEAPESTSQTSATDNSPSQS